MVHQIPNLFITFYISFKLVFLNREKTSPNTLACNFTKTGLCQENSRTENYGGNPLVSTKLWQNLKKNLIFGTILHMCSQVPHTCYSILLQCYSILLQYFTEIVRRRVLQHSDMTASLSPII